MSTFKNNPDYNLFYSDTDSIFIDNDLSENIIGSDIGKFKLEYIFKEGVFLGPKRYAGVTQDDKYICKVKGYKNSLNIDFNQFKSLFNKESEGLILTQSKWFRYLKDSNITIKEQLYKLLSTENKRILIYNSEGIAYNTEAYKSINLIFIYSLFFLFYLFICYLFIKRKSHKIVTEILKIKIKKC